MNDMKKYRAPQTLNYESLLFISKLGRMLWYGIKSVFDIYYRGSGVVQIQFKLNIFTGSSSYVPWSFWTRHIRRDISVNNT